MSARKRPVTSHELRRMSGDTLLRVLRSGEVMTASELMSATGMSRTSVHDVCADLLRLGWITEVSPDWPDEPGSGKRNGAAAERGRPPRRYVYAADAAAVIAVDMGVYTITLHVTDLRGTTQAVAQRHFDDPAGVDRLRILEELADEALAASGVSRSKVLVAAVGVPIAVSPTRTIDYPPEQRVIEVAQQWAQTHHWPVLVENDANLAALGERWRGVAQNHDNVVVILAGERLGAGIILDGRLVRGQHGSTGELRFVTLMPDIGHEHGLAWHTRTLAIRALDDGHATPQLRALAQRGPHGNEISALDVFRAAEADDESAQTIVTTVCQRLAYLVGALATLLDPAIVVISGGIAAAGDILASTTQSLLSTEMIDNPPTIAVSALGQQAVVHGAVSVALSHVEAHLLDDLGR